MKIKHIIAVFFLAILINSCSEDFLTLPSPSSLSTPVYFKTQTDFESAVNGIYATLRGWHMYDNIIIGDVHTDNSR